MERSLIEAVVKYEQLYKFLRQMERQTARSILNVVDLSLPAGPKRDALRTQVLDALAHQKREIQEWVSSAYGSTPRMEANPSMPSSPD